MLTLAVAASPHLGTGKPQPTCLCMACKFRMVFTFSNGWKKTSKGIFENYMKLCELQISVSLVLWEDSHTHCSFVYGVSVDAFALE